MRSHLRGTGKLSLIAYEERVFRGVPKTTSALRASAMQKVEKIMVREMIQFGHSSKGETAADGT